MDRATEIELIEELAGLREAGVFHLDDAVASSPVTRYTCPERFSCEIQTLFCTLPAVVAHCSELAGPDSSLTRDFAGLPLLLPADAETASYWRKNHDITVRALAEDFAIGESKQSGLPSGANDELRFGRLEGALDRINRIVDRKMNARTQAPESGQHAERTPQGRGGRSHMPQRLPPPAPGLAGIRHTVRSQHCAGVDHA